LTAELQETVSTGDDIRRYWEGWPGEPAWRTAARLAGGAAALAAIVLVTMLAATEGVRGWPRGALLIAMGTALAVPAYLFALTLLAAWMENQCYGAAGWSWRRVAMVAVALWLFTLLSIAGAGWPAWTAGWGPVTESMAAALIAAHSVVFACALGTS